MKPVRVNAKPNAQLGLNIKGSSKLAAAPWFMEEAILLSREDIAGEHCGNRVGRVQQFRQSVRYIFAFSLPASKRGPGALVHHKLRTM
jgi:hypothetical protein